MTKRHCSETAKYTGCSTSQRKEDFQVSQSINQSINLVFNVALATNSHFKDHRGEKQLTGKAGPPTPQMASD